MRFGEGMPRGKFLGRILVVPGMILGLVVSPRATAAQSLLDRTPNVSGDWTGAPGTIFFNFVHRFSVSPAPERKVSNVPTFLVAAGLPRHLLAGFNYSTNSNLAPRFPNEWELFARWSPLSQDEGSPLDLGGQVGYNNAANGVDGELSVGRKFGIIHLLAAGRALSDPVESGNVRFAFAGGGLIRLGPYVALAGDVASLTNRDSSERVAWSAGIHFAIPMTPHTVSLQMTNAPVATLQGQSRGAATRRYGFEFTIPLTLSRYFGGRAEPEAPPVTAAGDSAAMADTAARVAASDSIAKADSLARAARAPGDTLARAPTPANPSRVPGDTTSSRPVTGAAPPPAPAPSRAAAPGPKPVAPRPAAKLERNGMKNINYLRPRLDVTVGTTVEWTNRDPLAHTVTAVNGSFNSGLIQPGKIYRYTFNRAGTYNVYCIPHPFMRGTIVVRAP
jgi:plastocyanin